MKNKKILLRSLFVLLLLFFISAVNVRARAAQVTNYSMGQFVSQENEKGSISASVSQSSGMTLFSGNLKAIPLETFSMTSRIASLSTSSAPDELSSSDTSLPRKDTVDVSSFQSWMTLNDFEALRRAGVYHVVVKVSEGTSYTNPYAAQEIEYAEAAGLDVSVYHFADLSGATNQSSANSIASAEAAYFVNAMKNLGIPTNTVTIMDCEMPNVPSSVWTGAAQTFANKVKSLGYGIVKYYSSQNWVATGIMNASALGARNLWIAQYLYGKPSANNLQNTQYGAWQYTSLMYYAGMSQNAPLDTTIDYNWFFAPYAAGVSYQGHIQNIGWQGLAENGAEAGTTGKSLRMEAVKINVWGYPTNMSGGVTYSAHVQNIGWQSWVSNGAQAGTTGQSLRMEAIKIQLTGELANHYDVYYRAHVQNIGWQGWVNDGAVAGTTGKSLRMEALEIELVPKGAPAP